MFLQFSLQRKVKKQHLGDDHRASARSRVLSFLAIACGVVGLVVETLESLLFVTRTRLKTKDS